MWKGEISVTEGTGIREEEEENDSRKMNDSQVSSWSSYMRRKGERRTRLLKIDRIYFLTDQNSWIASGERKGEKERDSFEWEEQEKVFSFPESPFASFPRFPEMLLIWKDWSKVEELTSHEMITSVHLTLVGTHKFKLSKVERVLFLNILMWYSRIRDDDDDDADVSSFVDSSEVYD